MSSPHDRLFSYRCCQQWKVVASTSKAVHWVSGQIPLYRNPHKQFVSGITVRVWWWFLSGGFCSWRICPWFETLWRSWSVDDIWQHRFLVNALPIQLISQVVSIYWGFHQILASIAQRVCIAQPGVPIFSTVLFPNLLRSFLSIVKRIQLQLAVRCVYCSSDAFHSPSVVCPLSVR